MQADELINFGSFIKRLDVTDITPFLRNMYREQGDYIFMYMNQQQSFEHWFLKSFSFLKSNEGYEYWDNLHKTYCPII